MKRLAVTTFVCYEARRPGWLRQRSAVLFSLPGYELLLDTPPDIRELIETNGARTIHGIFLSHEHFDHVGGLAGWKNSCTGVRAWTCSPNPACTNG